VLDPGEVNKEITSELIYRAVIAIIASVWLKIKVSPTAVFLFTLNTQGHDSSLSYKLLVLRCDGIAYALATVVIFILVVNQLCV
jgi:hypothetical protein